MFSRSTGQFEICPHVLKTSIILGAYFEEINNILENFQFERMGRTFQELGRSYFLKHIFQEYIILYLS